MLVPSWTPLYLTRHRDFKEQDEYQGTVYMVLILVVCLYFLQIFIHSLVRKCVRLTHTEVIFLSECFSIVISMLVTWNVLVLVQELPLRCFGSIFYVFAMRVRIHLEVYPQCHLLSGIRSATHLLSIPTTTLRCLSIFLIAVPCTSIFCMDKNNNLEKTL